MPLKNPPRPNPEGRWTYTRVATPFNYTITQVGNFQEQIHQDSRGFLYRVVTEFNGLVYFISLYSNNGTAAEIDMDFINGPTMVGITTTNIAAGYPTNGIINVIEISSVLYGRKIYVAAIIDEAAHGRVIELIEFDIISGAVLHRQFYLPDSFGVNTSYTSIDIDAFKSTGKAFLWISFIEFETADRLYRWLQQAIPVEPQAIGNFLSTVDTVFQGIDAAQGTSFLGCRHSRHDRQLFSVSHGPIDTSGVMPAGITVPAAGDVYDGYVGWYCPNDAQQLSFIPLQPTQINRHPIPFQVQSTVSPREITIAGVYDINFNKKYASQMLLRWRRNADANATGWDLSFGVREEGLITFSATVYSVDYGNLGVIDIESQLEAISIFPECGISINEKGVTYLYALFPSLQNGAIGGPAGPGDLDGIPYMNIKGLDISSNRWYEPANKDWQTVEDGFNEQRGCRYLSTPNFIDSSRQPLRERLYITTHDTIDGVAVPTQFSMHTRHQGV